MSFRVRPAGSEDFPAIYEMAKLTGGGFTNLPADKSTLVDKLARSEECFAREERCASTAIFRLRARKSETGQDPRHVPGVRRGGRDPALLQLPDLRRSPRHRRELGKTFRAETLSLTTDFEGRPEVGGLFLHPGERAGGLGMLLARSRYLFIALTAPASPIACSPSCAA